MAGFWGLMLRALRILGEHSGLVWRLVPRTAVRNPM